MAKCWNPLVACAIIAGCAVAPSMYSYRVITDNCNCAEYHAVDVKHKIDYLFRASYMMNQGISTKINLTFVNKSRDTLFLDAGTVKISSRNVPYQYNDRFVPLPHLIIPPSSSDSVTMTGSEVSGENDWNNIAGEQLTLTLQGLRLGADTLPQQQVTFIPENPKLGNKR